MKRITPLHTLKNRTLGLDFWLTSLLVLPCLFSRFSWNENAESLAKGRVECAEFLGFEIPMNSDLCRGNHRFLFQQKSLVLIALKPLGFDFPFLLKKAYDGRPLGEGN